MKYVWLAGLLFTLLVGVIPAWGADDPRVENLALCRDSWLDWKNTDPAKLDSFGAFFRSAFTHNGNDAFLVPKSAMAIDGLKVTQVFPESVGMGLGFSVLVDATFDVAKQVARTEARQAAAPVRDRRRHADLRAADRGATNSDTDVWCSAERQDDPGRLLLLLREMSVHGNVKYDLPLSGGLIGRLPFEPPLTPGARQAPGRRTGRVQKLSCFT